ncbi:MAG: MucR family transcriptional regulator [Rhizobiaceae bacterium]|nr:MucR family transcriptional regulator [Rhizobiaceae bacterium]
MYKKEHSMNNPMANAGSEHQDIDYTLEMTAEVVSSYVGNNPVSTAELPKLISDVHGAFARLKGSRSMMSAEKRKPAVPIKKSLNDDYLICLEDGKKFKSLKRHLRSHFNLSPEDYREKWGLPHDYPMVAPNYAKERSSLARKMGLGRKPGTKLK